MKKKTKTAFLVVAILLIVGLFVPSPLVTVKVADGGTIIYGPLIPVYKIIDWNKFSINPHYCVTKRGITVYIFGVEVYDGSYTVDGTVWRESKEIDQ